jgi:DNA-binding NarL/FixJ family response regulator
LEQSVWLFELSNALRNTNYSDERIQGLIQTSQDALSRELKKLLETVLMEEDSVAEAPRPKRDKKQSNGNGGNADLIPGIGRLTQRELEIFTLIGRGLSNREIATKLDVSAYIVQTHRNHIKDKLKLPNSSVITYWAFLWARHKV